MREALAEQLPQNPVSSSEIPTLYAVPDVEERPPVHSVDETEFEPEAMERFERWIGSLAVQEGEAPATAESPAAVNLIERIRAANAKDPEALQWLAINVDTAIFEAVFKDGYVGETYMDRDSEGDLVQFGQTNDDIYHNAIALRPDRHRILKEITQAEALNRHRIETALEAGKLKDYHYVVFSLVPDSVPQEELGPEGDGYFLDRLTLNIQATTELKSGRIKTETAFTAGVEEVEDDTLEERLARRHDFKAVAKVYEWLGKEAPDTAARLLKSGVYIPKDMMPNGVADVRYWLDMATDEVIGRNVERKPEDYMGLRLESKRREASLQGVREKVIDDLLAVYDEPEVDDGPDAQMDAVQRLWDLVREHATEESFTNVHIDPKVFGRAAAPAIIKARRHIRDGDLEAAEVYMLRAHAEAVISGCGGGASPDKAARPSGGGSSENLEHVAGSDGKGSKAFRCSNGHLNIRPHNGTVEACQHNHCEAAVAC